ncbi:MAG: DUF4160 domain-containing protein, partial [Pseudomonadota bacterium]|nr:DUF4160 domain-containing protein [Pseudomonadota bacterium]
MAPTVLREGAFRLFFFSREESRMHVHISHSDGEAKYWLEPSIALAQNFGLSASLLRQAEQLVKTHEHRIRTAWNEHFGS